MVDGWQTSRPVRGVLTLRLRRPGGQEARRPGGQEARRPGGQEARRPGGQEASLKSDAQNWDFAVPGCSSASASKTGSCRACPQAIPRTYRLGLPPTASTQATPELPSWRHQIAPRRTQDPRSSEQQPRFFDSLTGLDRASNFRFRDHFGTLTCSAPPASRIFMSASRKVWPSFVTTHVSRSR